MFRRFAALPFRVAACGMAATTPALGADTLDPSWNGTGTLTVAVPGHELFVGDAATAVQPDGRILLGGTCRTGNTYAMCMARVRPDGSLDDGFGPGHSGAFVLTDLPSWPTRNSISGLALQSDGRIVIAGIAGGTQVAMARLAADGTLDPSVPVQPVQFEFEHNAALPISAVIAIAQADGKFVVAGYTIRADADPPNADFAVARLRADLSLDPTFNGTGMRVVAFDLGGNDSDYAMALAIQGDGRIVVAGDAYTASNGTDAAVLRLNADGTLDDSFGDDGRATFDFGSHHTDDVVNDVKVDGAGRIWLAGSHRIQPNNSDTDFLVARLRTDGTLDTDLDHVGYVTVGFDLDVATSHRMTDAARRVLLQPDGRIVLVGSASNTDATDHGFDFAAARLLPSGLLDPTFGPDGSGLLHGRFAAAMAVSQATDAAFDASGIVLAGSTFDTDGLGSLTGGRFALARIRLDAIFADGFER